MVARSTLPAVRHQLLQLPQGLNKHSSGSYNNKSGYGTPVCNFSMLPLMQHLARVALLQVAWVLLSLQGAIAHARPMV
jgi:hypothetical protein